MIVSRNCAESLSWSLTMAARLVAALAAFAHFAAIDGRQRFQRPPPGRSEHGDGQHQPGNQVRFHDFLLQTLIHHFWGLAGFAQPARHKAVSPSPTSRATAPAPVRARTPVVTGAASIVIAANEGIVADFRFRFVNAIVVA